MKSNLFIKILRNDFTILFLFLLSLFFSELIIYFFPTLQLDFNLDILLFILFFTFIFQKLRIGHSISELGLFFDKNVLQNLLILLYIFIFSLVIISFILVLSYLFLDIDIVFNAIKLLNYNFIIYIAIMAIIEELLFRAFILQILEENLGKIWAILITSFLFSLVHFTNPNITFFAHINIFLAGILFAVIYIKSRSLYPSIMFHFLWNISLVMIFNSPISGMDYKVGIININYNNEFYFYNYIVGGDFGFEGGLICTLILIISIIMSFKYFVENPYLMAIKFKREYSLKNK